MSVKKIPIELASIVNSTHISRYMDLFLYQHQQSIVCEYKRERRRIPIMKKAQGKIRKTQGNVSEALKEQRLDDGQM